MKLCLCTLALNEMQWLPSLWEQHRAWPGVDLTWIFVESADRVFAETNPDLVTYDGLSTDGTTDYLGELARVNPRVLHIPHGLACHPDPAQGKCAARQRYLDAAEKVQPDFLLVLDADEFHTRADQEGIVKTFQVHPRVTGFSFHQRHVWRPPVVADLPLFSYEVRGGFWSIPHVRGWRWQRGLRYVSNHNTPETAGGRRLDLQLRRFASPQCIHLGFAASAESRRSKHAYYEARGEKVDARRAWYCESRASWEKWRPGDTLPRGAEVVPWTGDVPEVFQ